MSFFRKMTWWLRGSHDYEITIDLPQPTHLLILDEIRPYLNRLLQDDAAGRAYRQSIAHWPWMPHPPLSVYKGATSECRIYGPRQWTYSGEERPLCGWVCSQDVVTDLNGLETYTLQQAIKQSIDHAIENWMKTYHPRPPGDASLFQARDAHSHSTESERP